MSNKAPKQNWLDVLRNSGNSGRTKICKPAAAAAAAAAAGGLEAEGSGQGAKVALPSEGKHADDSAFKVLYRFNEGYTNAVKRPLLMSELL